MSQGQSDRRNESKIDCCQPVGGGSPGHPCPDRNNGQVPSFRFEELAAGGCMVQIELQGTTYTLRRTKAGGLILNK